MLDYLLDQGLENTFGLFKKILIFLTIAFACYLIFLWGVRTLSIEVIDIIKGRRNKNEEEGSEEDSDNK